MFNSGDDLGPVPSLYMAEVTAVDVENHTCSVILLRGMDQYNDVIIMRDPGNFNLPTVGDLCAVFWDNKNRPVINGVYPTYHREDLETHKNYNVTAGERLIQSEFGQKLLMTKSGKIVLTNWSDQGIEIEEKTGMVFIKSTDSVLVDVDGIIKRDGATKRESKLGASFNTIYSLTDAGGPTDGVTTLGSTKLIETATILEEEDTGYRLYESVVGNMVVDEGSTIGSPDPLTPEFIGIPLHSKTGYALRAKTKYYIEGFSDGVEMEIDVLGNTNVSFPPTMTDSGLTLEELTGVASLALNFKNINIGGPTTTGVNVFGSDLVNINSNTLVNINSAETITASGSTSVTLDSQGTIDIGDLTSGVTELVLNTLIPLLKTHTHPAPGGATSASTELATIDDGTHETTVTKAN